MVGRRSTTMLRTVPARWSPAYAIPASALGAPAADRLVGSSTTPIPLPIREGSYVGDLAWLAQAANGSDNSDQQRKEDVAILALEVVFAQYGA